MALMHAHVWTVYLNNSMNHTVHVRSICPNLLRSLFFNLGKEGREGGKKKKKKLREGLGKGVGRY